MADIRRHRWSGLWRLGAGLAALATIVGVFLPRAADAIGSLSVTTTPALSPSFDPSITTYVVRCGTGTTAPTTVTVSVTAPAGTTVSVDNTSPQTGTFSVPVSRAWGQGFAWVVTTGGSSTTYHARCLPSDFPAYTAQVSGTPQAAYYVAAFGVGSYVAIFDANGVPVWWWKDASGVQPVDASLDPGSPSANPPVAPTIDITNSSGSTGGFGGLNDQVLSLTGQVLATVVSPDYGNADIHDIQPMANGDYLMDVYPTTSGVDMSSIGGPASTCVVDGAVEEVSPTGTLVWKWLLSQHLSPTEINKEIQATAAGSTCASPKDVWHLNSVADEGSDVLISVRYAGLYLIDKASGNILWKLGGSTTSNSLTIVGDSATPAGGLGQHDARIEPDGTVSFFDNGNVGNVKSSEARSPRVVSYTVSTGISPTVGTATLATSITDPAITTSSACCGSARQLSAGGDWVIGWGIDNIETEVTSGGSRVFSLTGPSSGLYTYRFLPVAAGVLSPAALRSDMDAMYPPTPGWRVDAAPQAGTASQFNAVQALNDSDVWAAGSYVLGGVSWPFVDHWTGPTGGWQVLPAAKGGSSSTFTSMSVLGDSDVWAAGSYVLSGVAWPFVEQWNGTTWNVLAAPKSGTSSVFNAIKAVSDTNIWVSGYYVQGGVNHPLVDHWNGVTWQVLPAAQGGSASQFNSITVLGNNDVWAGGWYLIGNSNLSFVERWNGSSWSVLAAPQAGTSSQFNAMTALGDSDVWAAGAYVLGGVTSPFVDQWNGTTWNVLAAPQAGTSSQFNAMAVLSDTDVWTAGSYLQSGASAPLVDHWNGSTWQVLVPPIAGSASQFNGLSVLSDTDLWGAGAYSQGGTNWPFLEQFGVGPT